MNGDVTQVLVQATAGDRAAVDGLASVVYDELRRLAQHHLAGENADHTLQATALANEAYLKLIDQTRVEWRNRAHFLAIASQAIRRILIDHARGKARDRRGGARQRVPLDDDLVFSTDSADDLLALDDAMQQLAQDHPEKAAVVEMRFFGGLSEREIAEVMGVATRTIERHWQFARAWLYRKLSAEEDS